MFEESSTTTSQGDVGEARAIYELIRRGFIVSKPINDKASYDLIADSNNTLYRVQVKTSRHKAPQTKTGYAVKLETAYANRNSSKRKPKTSKDFDLLFVLIETGDAWLIPSNDLEASTGLTVGTPKYERFKLTEEEGKLSWA